MKTILPPAFIFLILSMTSLLAGTYGYLTYEVVSGTEIRITDCSTSASGTITIPATLEGKPVTLIGYQAFQDCTSITSINIPENVKNIGGLAFYHCSSLTSVVFPESLTEYLGAQAFKNCTALKRAVFKGNAPTSSSSDTFDNTATGFKIYYADDATGFSNPWNGYPTESYDYRFSFDIQSGTPETIKITDYPTTETGEVDVPSTIVGLSVTSIGAHAFDDCGQLTRVSLPNSITVIATYAFNECNGLTTFTIPANVTSIGESAFADAGIDSFFFEGDAPDLGDYVFDGYTPTVYYLDGAQGFDSSPWTYAVKYTGLYDFVVYKETIKITDYPDTETGGLTIPDTIVGKPVTRIGESAFDHCNGLTRITLPDSLEQIYRGAFEYCSALTTITIPSNVNYIGFGAYGGCALESVFFDGDVPATLEASLFDGVEGFTVYYRDGSSGFSEPTWNGYASGTYSGPLSFKVIANESIEITDCPFTENGENDRLVIPSEIVGKPVTSIGMNAFYNNISHEIAIPSTCTNIGYQAFRGCRYLFKMTIPAKVSFIHPTAFIHCNGLSEFIVESGSYDYSTIDGILYSKDQKTLVKYPDSKTGSFNHLSIPEGVERIEEFACAFSWTLYTVTIPESVTSIGEGAFYQSDRLEKVVFFGATPTVGAAAFSSNDASLKIYYRSSQASTGYSSPTWEGVACDPFDSPFTFEFHSYPSEIKITKSPTDLVGPVIIPETITDCEVSEIGALAFYRAREITSVLIPANMKQIAPDAFRDCNALENFYVTSGGSNYYASDGVLCQSGNGLLIQCPQQKSGDFIVPSLITTIATYAFDSCSQLTGVTLSKNLQTIEDRAFVSCQHLASVTIPENVTHIGKEAFAGCSGLKRAIFLGNGTSGGASILGTDVFVGADNDFRIYFLSTKSGFTDPHWEGYPSIRIDMSIYPAALWLLDKGLLYDEDTSKDLSGDGVSLFMDYALDLNPFENEAQRVPSAVVGDSTMEFSFSEVRSNLTYQVEVSPDLTPNSWTTDGVTITGGSLKTAVYFQSGERMFMRLRVEGP